MKKFLMVMVILAFVGSAIAQNPNQYATSRTSGTIMISGSGTYETDLSQELKSSKWNIGTDAALFLFPQFAGGIEFGYGKKMVESGNIDEPTVSDSVSMYLGPRIYLFLGGKKSQVTPFIKAGANYNIDKILIDDEEQERDEQELGLVASAGLLLNLAKNVGLSVEAEYNFAKGTAAEDIDTQQLLIKFGIRSFLGN